MDFFKDRGHTVIPSAPLVPENDPTTLFTSSGMQPLVQNLLGQPHPSGKLLVNSQKCIRTQDIEEVGDNRHITFFEMLGNWSLGDYFKKEQLSYFFEFLTKELGLPKEKLTVTVFEGNNQIPRDNESAMIWKDLGVPEGRIFYYGVNKNWWSRSGIPENMPVGEPGGPDSEVFFEFTQVEHNQKFGDKCHPNCDCGRFLEIGNSVFMQYVKQIDGTFKELPQKNVDFGGGLERLTAAVNNDPDIFKTDLFWPIIKSLNIDYEQNQTEARIISDHIKAATFLMAEGVEPHNKGRGYVLRRLIRRAVFKLETLGFPALHDIRTVSESVIKTYLSLYFEQRHLYEIFADIGAEVDKFQSTIHKGNIILINQKIDDEAAFNLFQSYGFPFELTQEIARKKGIKLEKAKFEMMLKIHQDLSRTAGRGMFKGGLQDASEITTRYHTATHLLHASLRKILGDHVSQKGSNITGERLRFDFSHDRKLSAEQLGSIESLVNKKIDENIKVEKLEMKKDEALKLGALAFFPEKYPEVTSIYKIGDFSLELCGGPHVGSTGQIQKIKIIKEESVSHGVRRIYATALFPQK